MPADPVEIRMFVHAAQCWERLAVAQAESGDKNRFHCKGVDKLTDNAPARSLCYRSSG